MNQLYCPECSQPYTPGEPLCSCKWVLDQEKSKKKGRSARPTSWSDNAIFDPGIGLGLGLLSIFFWLFVPFGLLVTIPGLVISAGALHSRGGWAAAVGIILNLVGTVIGCEHMLALGLF